MANLQYDITVVGANQIRSVIRGVEAEILASNKRMTAGIRGTSGAGAGRPKLGTGNAGSGAAEAKALSRVRITEEEKVARARERLHARFVAFEGTEIERITRQRLAALDKERAARTRLAESMAKGVGTAVHNTARTAMMGATVIGGALIASALHDQIGIQAGASRVANQGMRPDLKNQIAKESQNQRGFTGEESINALDQFVQKSSDVEGALSQWKMLGVLANATSTSFEDMGNAGGRVWRLLSESVKDPLERAKQFKDVMTTIAVQGNMETVEARDLAPVLGKVTSATRRYGGDPIQSLKELLALGQLSVSKGGATDAAEETTSLGRFTDDMIKDASGKKGKKNKGFNPFTDDTQSALKSPVAMALDIMDRTHGDLTKISGYAGVRGQRVVSGIQSTYMGAYREAEKIKKGSGEAAGHAAVMASVKPLINATKDINAADDLRNADPDKQFIEATKQFNRAIGEQLLPAVTKLIPKFVELVPAATYLTGELVKFVNALADNPIEGIGVLILGKITADIAAAGIGKGLSFLLTGIIKSAIPGATGGLVGPAAGLAGAGVGLAARGITGAATGVTSALGVAGAAGGVALGAAAGLAAAGVGAAAYEGKQLYNVTQGFTDWGTDVAKAGTPEDYDAMMKKAGLSGGGQGGAEANAATTAAAAAQTDAAKEMKSAAADLRVASANIRTADPNRTKPIVARAP